MIKEKNLDETKFLKKFSDENLVNPLTNRFNDFNSEIDYSSKNRNCRLLEILKILIPKLSKISQ